MTDTSLIHPFQDIVCNKDGTLLYAVVKNMVQVYKFNAENSKVIKIGEWKDEFDSTILIKEKVIKEQQRQIEKNGTGIDTNTNTAVGTNTNKKLKTNNKEAKIPTPGTGAPPIYRYIRSMLLSRNEKKLIICTDSDKAAVIFNINYGNDNNVLSLFKRQPFPKRPSAITTTLDDRKLLLADKFGDVYEIDMNDEKVQSSETLEPVLGHVSMLTDIGFQKDNATDQSFVISCDRDEHIKISHYPQTFIVNKWLFGHEQFISSIVLPQWNNDLLFSGGGDDNIFSWNWKTGELLDKFNYSELISPYINEKFHLAPERFQNNENNLIEYAVSKIISFPNLPYIAFFVEATNCFFVLKVDCFTGKLTFVHKVETETNVIAMTSSVSSLVVSLDTIETPKSFLLKFYNINKNGVIEEDELKANEFDSCIKDQIKDNQVFKVENKDKDVYPLYHVSSLRKHGEH
ncbi:related to tRNA (guanine-N(7)-)-methyltransferase subunit TRM82 [Saccharomycodes ludwigii]|uniref:Related to tRNA (Guanine-N(7)-)-methyltransferase subunit TRM82 n=1 Tax=Saccharomycodes ludwigii TaxID=36035 RepID=A0A376BAA1_9ASCO|nr:hypothetical protein SCDLUD_001797 [Saccharomycodes ludwigii]KAH3902009.1 hypothetical protein SCDLUD_001797 [Saccharomycodes ludwigii]SSD61567.1 related to tRNA (guanine-N(7)-)-methyltransferase subunit TRM82 [Saccharomycodes ludwigii]